MLAEHTNQTSPDPTTAVVLPPAATPRLQQRIAALDGLRGVAICLVLLFHAQIGFMVSDPNVGNLATIFRCGWVGVDIFFVLSGFLITGILLDTRHCGNYFSAFFARRILRIFPLYYLVLICVFLGIPWILGAIPGNLKSLFDRQWWFWTYSSNIGYVVERRAFGNTEWLWLDHFWSLAVEEQFYLVWPFAVRWLTPQRLRILCLVMVLGSLGLRCGLAIAGMTPGALYFPTICRLDGLAAGAFAAIEIRNPTIISQARYRNVLLALSLASLLAICFFRGGINFDDYWSLTAGLTFIAVASSLVVFQIAKTRDDKTPFQSFLRNPVLCFFGKYSYGIYVIHHLLLPLVFLLLPAATISRYVGGPLGAAVVSTSLIFMISVVSAVLSWHLLESQFLKLKRYFEYV